MCYVSFSSSPTSPSGSQHMCLSLFLPSLFLDLNISRISLLPQQTSLVASLSRNSDQRAMLIGSPHSDYTFKKTNQKIATAVGLEKG
nr:hypothetical protein [Tanacetum cinerariifolium]